MTPPKCKLCDGAHWSRVCPKPKTAAKERIKDIENQPVKPSAAGKAKKEKAAARTATKVKKRKTAAKKAKKKK